VHQYNFQKSNIKLSFLILDSNPGNFQRLVELIKQFASEDLRSKLDTMPKNCTWRSKTIQNQIINIFEEYILEAIVEEVNKRKFFSVMADEATDVSNKEQMAIVIRYLSENLQVEEKFVGFIHCKNGTSGEALARLIENKIKEICIQNNALRIFTFYGVLVWLFCCM